MAFQRTRGKLNAFASRRLRKQEIIHVLRQTSRLETPMNVLGVGEEIVRGSPDLIMRHMGLSRKHAMGRLGRVHAKSSKSSRISTSAQRMMVVLRSSSHCRAFVDRPDDDMVRTAVLNVTINAVEARRRLMDKVCTPAWTGSAVFGSFTHFLSEHSATPQLTAGPTKEDFRNDVQVQRISTARGSRGVLPSDRRPRGCTWHYQTLLRIERS